MLQCQCDPTSDMSPNIYLKPHSTRLECHKAGPEVPERDKRYGHCVQERFGCDSHSTWSLDSMGILRCELCRRPTRPQVNKQLCVHACWQSYLVEVQETIVGVLINYGCGVLRAGYCVSGSRLAETNRPRTSHVSK